MIRYRGLVRLILLMSTVYGFWLVYDMDPYLPWRVCFLKGIFWTTIVHFGLWVATFEVRSRLRFIAVPFFLLSIVGGPILWWHIDLILAIAALGFSIWLFLGFFEGESLAN